MTHNGNHAQANSQSAVPVVLFGVDDTGKPKAARFAKEQADLAIKAAAQLQLRSLAVTSPDVAEVAKRLPVGRIHGNGRNIVPNVSRDLYEQLLALAEPAASLPQASSPVGSATLADKQQRPQATRPCRVTGTRSAEATSSSRKRRPRKAGTRRLSTTKPQTC